MKFGKFVSTCGVVLLGAVSLAAQGQPGNLAALEFQTPKNGAVKEYEAGRKQKVDWHKQQKDSQSLMVWEIISGDQTGTYIVGRLGQHWADLDKPSVPDAADLETYRKLIAANVQTLVTRYYQYMPKVSNPASGAGPAKFSEIITYHVRPDRETEFRSSLARITEAIQKTKAPLNYYWYELVNGGPGDTFVLSIPHANWADFEDNPNVKPFREMLKDAFNAVEADIIIKQLDASVQSSESEIIQFRDDLSYIPAK
jgi:quinol monooxygenase YgiN